MKSSSRGPLAQALRFIVFSFIFFISLSLLGFLVGLFNGPVGAFITGAINSLYWLLLVGFGVIWVGLRLRARERHAIHVGEMEKARRLWLAEVGIAVLAGGFLSWSWFLQGQPTVFALLPFFLGVLYAVAQLARFKQQEGARVSKTAGYALPADALTPEDRSR